MCKYRQYIHKYSTINPQISLRNLYAATRDTMASPDLIIKFIAWYIACNTVYDT